MDIIQDEKWWNYDENKFLPLSGFSYKGPILKIRIHVLVLLTVSLTYDLIKKISWIGTKSMTHKICFVIRLRISDQLSPAGCCSSVIVYQLQVSQNIRWLWFQPLDHKLNYILELAASLLWYKSLGALLSTSNITKYLLHPCKNIYFAAYCNPIDACSAKIH